MNSNKIRYGMAFAVLTGSLLVPAGRVEAADQANKEKNSPFPTIGIESMLQESYDDKININMQEILISAYQGEYSNMGFADVNTGSYLYIRSGPTKESEWVGKLYSGYAAHITGEVGEWTPVESGNVKGYVKTEYLLNGQAAEDKTSEILAQADLQNAEPEFAFAESREEEAQRLAAEEQKRQEEQQAALEAAAAQEAEAAASQETQEAVAPAASSNGQAVVDYAVQFIGNPYVWGGTSLTNGADCSGFVQSVYKNFGISMPRTSGEMRSAGVAVSYEQAIPGDVFCYDGHVGIYIGNGEIVNAIDSAHGIGISSATYTNIITIRRLL